MVCHTGTSLAGSRPHQYLFSEIYHTSMLQDQYASLCIPDYLKTSAIALARGAWFSTQGALETICRLDSTRICLGSSQHSPDLLAEFGEWTGNGYKWKGWKGLRREKRKGSKRGKWDKVSYWHFFCPLPALVWTTILTSLQWQELCPKHATEDWQWPNYK